METKFIRRTWAEIDLHALAENLAIVRRVSEKPVYAVVKADAYGHGAVEVAAVLNDAGIAGFAVSNLSEAEILLESGIHKPILILGYTPMECVSRLAREGVMQCLYSPEYAAALNEAAEKAGVTVTAQLKLDTGMGRIGFDFRAEDGFDLSGAAQALSLKNIDTVGVFTHFSVADSEDPSDLEFTKLQHQRFEQAVAELEKIHPFRYHHCCNSAGALRLQGDKGDLVRAGIILYGLSPSDEVALPEGIRPVMSVYSVISMVKTVAQDQPISYGRTYTTPAPRRIATVTAGYADGVPRLLSGKGSVLIHGKRAPIVGRVCMDQICVDVTDIPEAAMGDTVTIFGPGLPVEEVAEAAQTVNYEIICGITKRVPRVYINHR